MVALDDAGFDEPSVRQTLFADPAGLDAPEGSEPGFGDSSFVVVAAPPAV